MSERDELRREEQRRAEHLTLRHTKARAIRSRLPAGVKSTLLFILEHIGSATDYQLAWVSQSQIAEQTGQGIKTVEAHIRYLTQQWSETEGRAIKFPGLLLVETLGLEVARLMLKNKFQHKLTGHWPHRLNFYSINVGHPFWAGDDGVLVDIKKMMVKQRQGKRKKQCTPDDSMNVEHPRQRGDSETFEHPRRRNREHPRRRGPSFLR